MKMHASSYWSIALLLLVSIGPTSAQVERIPLTPNAVLPGITVSGHGAVRVSGDRMRLIVRVFFKPPANDQVADSTGKSIAEIMRGHGVPDASWTIPLSGNLGGGNSVPVIVGTIAKPTREKAEAILRVVLAALPDSVTAVVQNPQVQTSLLVDDCSSAEGRAQSAAFADARRRAESVSRDAGVQLGSVTSVLQTSVLASACTSAGDGSYGNGFEALGPLETTVSINETVTFAIR